MRIREYQLEALKTDQVPRNPKSRDDSSIMVPLLGLAGEAGTLLTEYKKRLREGASHQFFRERVVEELGDILWYIANIASKEELDLETIANENLLKVKRRWMPESHEQSHLPLWFDEAFPANEQLPRELKVEFGEDVSDGRIIVKMKMDGSSFGNELSDNSYESDGYRYHDVFHLAYAAVLGWSPVVRKLLDRKRKSNVKFDQVEDGGRATAIEEGISALVFGYANEHAYLEGVDFVDYGILRTIKQLTSHLEVRACSEHQWQEAILFGFSVWRQLRRFREGIVVADLERRTLTFEPISV